MPRKVRDAAMETRAARQRLAVRREPYWRTIQGGRAFGYRRIGGKAGTWIARHNDPVSGRQYHALGNADDAAEADGVDTLTFAQAQAAALAWFAELARNAGKVVRPLTVREAAASYVDDYTARGGKGRSDTNHTIDVHILPSLGDRRIGDLSVGHLREWQRGLVLAPARLRSKANASEQRTRAAPTAEAKRARRATANRILSVLKAILNHAYRDGRITSDDAWRRLKPYPKVDVARVRYLTDDECRRLLNACPRDFRALVTAALLTGARYGELSVLQPADIDLAAGMLTIRAAKSGSPRSVVLTDEGVTFFALAMAGRQVREPLLTRHSAEPWGKSNQFRLLRLACSAAKITPAVSFHILRHTYASRLAMKGVPMAVIAAQLGHANISMTTKHYGHLSPGYVADTIRAAFGSLGIEADNDVMPIGAANRG